MITKNRLTTGYSAFIVTRRIKGSRFYRQTADNFRNRIEKPEFLLLNKAIAFIGSALSQWIITAAKIRCVNHYLYCLFTGLTID
ncbi:hypothetical protein NM75_05205 [Dickeya fangzhongdai]|nr:hypothetical protein LH89_01840 [Dickeya fangzhongdai]KGT99310.1 hypothetical protein NM75_05205 [Dickeya fangzhongdai]